MSDSEIKNITDYLYIFARSNPDKPALLHPQLITFFQLCRTIDCYAFGFLENGISKGTKTIVLIKPGIDLFAATYALLRIGAIPIMIDPGMGNKNMSVALSKVRAEAFVGVPKALRLKYLFPRYFTSIKIWISTKNSFWRQGISLEYFSRIKKSEYTPCKVEPNETAAIFFTSGSTGPAKGVIYKSAEIDAQIQILKNHFRYLPVEVDLCTFPLIGLLIMCLGISVVLADMDMTHPVKLVPEKLINNIEQFECSHLFCSPMVLQKLAKYGNENHIQLSSLKRVMIAGAPVSLCVLREFGKLLSESAEIHTPYGATEALPVSDIEYRELLELDENCENHFQGICVGYPLDSIDIQIINITDEPIGFWTDAQIIEGAEVGEIVVLGPNVTQEYMSNDEANQKSKIFDANSGKYWHRTGDLGRQDEKGRIWFYGRKSQRIEAKELRMFTIPCEAVFNQHPLISRSALVGVKLNNGTIPVICVELVSGIKNYRNLENELLKLAEENHHTESIRTILFYKCFPVDPRHNAKIFREKLAVWAQKQIK